MSTEWSLIYDGIEPEQEGLREAMCVLGNGYFATRGAWPESRADGTHYPGTYVAGLYNRLTTEIAGRDIENEDLVNVPNWLVLDFRIEDGPWVSLHDVEVLAHRQELDLRRGQLVRHVEFRDSEGRETAFTQRRLVHMSELHIAGLQTTFLPKNWSGRMEVRSGIDGTVINAGVPRYRQLSSQHLEVLEVGADQDDIIYLAAQTVQSKVRLGLAARTRIHRNGDAVEVGRQFVDEDGFVSHEVVFEVEEGIGTTVEKVVTLFTSRDTAISEPLHDARRRLHRAEGYDELLQQHLFTWGHLWRRFDMKIGADTMTQMIVRLHIFHLLQTVSENTIDLDVGVPARGWHGEAYRGHIFWDELFIFPMLNLRVPVMTRSLLMYRRRRLDAARHAARKAGLRGAQYPWQSGSNGREESQRVHLNPQSGNWLPDHSHLQRHIDIAIAWNVWQYYEVTEDLPFLRYHGAPMLIEIARFLANITTYNRGLDRYEILGVMGPDEYHDGYPDAEEPGLNNNAYTNVMTVWTILRVFDLLERMPPYQRDELQEQLGLTTEELDRWGDISRKMLVPFHEDDGERVISQFEGYEDLEEFDWDGYRRRYDSIARLDRILEAEGDTPNRYKASKQADVLMLFFLLSADELAELFNRLGYELDDKLIQRNIDYYQQRTSHGSTLSSVVQAWVLARADRKRAWEFFETALQADISDIQGGTTPEGIHLGAMAGSVDLVGRAFTGLETRGDVLRLDPQLPEEMHSLEFEVFYRGHRLHITIDQSQLSAASEPGDAPPIQVVFRDEPHEIYPGESHSHVL